MDLLQLIGAANFGKDVIDWIGDKIANPEMERMKAEQRLNEVRTSFDEAKAETRRCGEDVREARERFDLVDAEARGLRAHLSEAQTLLNTARTNQTMLEADLRQAQLNLAKWQQAEAKKGQPIRLR